MQEIRTNQWRRELMLHTALATSLQKLAAVAAVMDANGVGGTGGFQSQVNVAQAPGVEGDFCSYNPRFSANAGPGAFVSGPAGCVVGRFAWFTGTNDPDNAPTLVQSQFSGYQFLGAANPDQVLGFIHREQQALITQFLGDATLTVPQGFPVTVMSGGDFWALNRGTITALPGMKAYARFTDGAVQFANAATPTQAAQVTASIAPALATFTGSILGNVLTVTALASGTLTPGMTLSGSGGTASIATNTAITAQLSGTPGGIGAYSLNIGEQTVPGPTAPGTITVNGSVGLMTVSATLSGTLGVGQILSGSGGGGVVVGTTLMAQVSPTTFFVAPSQTLTSTTVSAQGNIETKWYAMSQGAVGELVKITSHPLG